MAARSKTKKSVRVNFKDAPRGGRVPEGEYKARVASVELAKGKDSGEDYLVWAFEVVSKDKEVAGKTLKTNTSLLPQALWRLRMVLECLDVEVLDEPQDIDFGDLVGLECMITVEDERYEGQKQSKITDYAPLSGTSKSKSKKDEDEDEPKSKKKKRKALLAADVEDMDEEELDALIEEHDIEIPRKATTRSKKAKAAIEALTEAGVIEEED